MPAAGRRAKFARIDGAAQCAGRGRECHRRISLSPGLAGAEAGQCRRASADRGVLKSVGRRLAARSRAQTDGLIWASSRALSLPSTSGATSRGTPLLGRRLRAPSAKWRLIAAQNTAYRLQPLAASATGSPVSSTWPKNCAGTRRQRSLAKPVARVLNFGPVDGDRHAQRDDSRPGQRARTMIIMAPERFRALRPPWCRGQGLSGYKRCSPGNVKTTVSTATGSSAVVAVAVSMT